MALEIVSPRMIRSRSSCRSLRYAYTNRITAMASTSPTNPTIAVDIPIRFTKGYTGQALKAPCAFWSSGVAM